MSKSHTPARNIGKDQRLPDVPGIDTGYPELPAGPGLVGGPATEAVPGSHRTHSGPATVTDDGGETTLPGRPRETGGDRPKDQDEKERSVDT